MADAGGEADLDAHAAGLRADAGEAPPTLEALAAKLEQILPSHTTVSRGGLLSRGKLRRIEVRLGDVRLRLEPGPAGPAGWREQEVGGIAINRRELPLAGWLQALREGVAEAAAESAEARAALEGLLL